MLCASKPFTLARHVIYHYFPWPLHLRDAWTVAFQHAYLCGQIEIMDWFKSFAMSNPHTDGYAAIRVSHVCSRVVACNRMR